MTTLANPRWAAANSAEDAQQIRPKATAPAAADSPDDAPDDARNGANAPPSGRRNTPGLAAGFEPLLLLVVHFRRQADDAAGGDDGAAAALSAQSLAALRQQILAERTTALAALRLAHDAARIDAADRMTIYAIDGILSNLADGAAPWNRLEPQLLRSNVGGQAFFETLAATADDEIRELAYLWMCAGFRGGITNSQQLLILRSGALQSLERARPSLNDNICPFAYGQTLSGMPPRMPRSRSLLVSCLLAVAVVGAASLASNLVFLTNVDSLRGEIEETTRHVRALFDG